MEFPRGEFGEVLISEELLEAIYQFKGGGGIYYFGGIAILRNQSTGNWECRLERSGSSWHKVVTLYDIIDFAFEEGCKQGRQSVINGFKELMEIDTGV